MHKHWDISQNIFYYVPQEEKKKPVEVWNDVSVSNVLFFLSELSLQLRTILFTLVCVYKKQFIAPLLCFLFYFLFVISFWHVISTQFF